MVMDGADAEVELWGDLRASAPEPIMVARMLPAPGTHYKDLVALKQVGVCGVVRGGGRRSGKLEVGGGERRRSGRLQVRVGGRTALSRPPPCLTCRPLLLPALSPCPHALPRPNPNPDPSMRNIHTAT